MSSGDRIPEPQYEVDANGDLISIPFATRVNKILTMSVLGVPRQVNHIEWVQVTGGDGLGWTQRIERDGYYDRETGLLIGLYNNTTKTYSGNRFYNEVHIYEMNFNNVWGGHDVGSTGIGVQGVTEPLSPYNIGVLLASIVGVVIFILMARFRV
jgi:hypothetical protein